VFGESEKSEMKVCRSIIFSQHFKVPGRMTSEKKTIQALSLVSTSVFGMPKKETAYYFRFGICNDRKVTFLCQIATPCMYIQPLEKYCKIT
jgi:hypothetical protein